MLLTAAFLAMLLVLTALTTTVAVTTPAQPAKWWLVGASASVAVWLVGDVLSNAAATGAEGKAVALLSVLAWAFIPYLILRTALAYTRTQPRRARWLIEGALLLPGLTTWFLEFSGQLHGPFIPAAETGGWFAHRPTAWQPIVGAYFLVYLVAATAVLWRAAHRAESPEYRRTARFVAFVLMPVAVLSLIVNAVLRALAVHLPIVDSFAAGLIAAVVGVEVWRRNLFAPLAEAERKLTAAVEAVESRYRALVDASPDSLGLAALDGRPLLVNAKGALMHGFKDSTEALAGARTVLDFVAPADRRRIAALLQRVLDEGELSDVGYTALRADGSTFPAEFNLRLGRDARGRPQVIVGVTRDISARRQAEEEKRRFDEQLQHTQRLESLGVLASGIAHDFNNLLAGMLGNAALALAELPPDAKGRPRLERITLACERAALLTRALLAYAGVGAFRLEPVRLPDLVTKLTPLLQVSVAGRVRMECDLKPDTPTIHADSAQIQQIVMNLVTNAAEAIGDDEGTITVRAGTLTVSADSIVAPVVGAAPAPGRYAMLEVADTGPGIDDALRHKIFEPFFTTKFAGRGLGLAVVLGNARRHLASIQIEDIVPHGTLFRVLFPAATRPQTPAPEPTRAPRTTTADATAGTILVADDDDMAREVATTALERAGFRVLAARDGRECATLFDSRADEIVAAVLDLVMPGMSGSEVYARVRRQRPELPVVFISGLGSDAVSACLADDRCAAFIQKPFDPEALVERVRVSLARTGVLGAT